MGKQVFDVIDYLGPIAVSVLFLIILFVLSVFINFYGVTKEDDRTIFENVSYVIYNYLSLFILQWGSRHSVRLGPHRMRHRPHEVVYIFDYLFETMFI
jgi:hypothetical protein